jgi:hypothetical protein
MEIEGTTFGTIKIDGKSYEHDVIIRLSGEVVKRKKKLSKKYYGTSHVLSKDEAKFVFEKSERRLDLIRPIASIGIDAAAMLDPVDQHIGRLGCDDEFLRLESVSDEGHSEAEAGSSPPVTDATLRLRFEIGLKNRLIFGRKRSFLTLSPRFACVERGLAWEPRHPPEDTCPLTAQVGALGLVDRPSDTDRRDEYCDQRCRFQCDGANQPSIEHIVLRSCRASDTSRQVAANCCGLLLRT